MKLSTIFTDETGDLSSSRCLLWLVLGFTGAVIWRHLNGADIDNAVWTLLGSIVTLLTVWAAGPRMAQYLMPAVGHAASAIASAIKRKPQEPDMRRDDER